jgi:tetratricopeptide (TPR) repeat protein
MSDLLDEAYCDALEALADGEILDAKQILKTMLAQSPQDARTLEIQGDCARADGDRDAAISNYTQLCNANHSAFFQGRGHLSLSYLHAGEDASDNAITHLQQAIVLFDQAQAESDHIIALCQLGDLFFSHSRFHDSSQTYEKVIQRYGNAELDEEDMICVIDAGRQLGDCYRLMGRIEEAEVHYQTVVQIGVESDLPTQLASALDGLGVLQQMQGFYDEARDYHLQALEINTKLEDSDGISVNLGNLARLSVHLERWDDAEDYAKRTLEIAQSEECLKSIRFAKLLLAEIELGRGNYDVAEKQFLQLEKLISRSGEEDDYLCIQSQLAFLYRLQKRYAEAERLQHEVLALAERMQHADGIAASLDEIAYLHFTQGNHTEAKRFWERALEKYRSINSTKMIAQVENQLKKLGNKS